MTIPTDRPITAEDCKHRHSEAADRWAASQADFFKPMIKRTFEIMRERGLIPPDPGAK